MSCLTHDCRRCGREWFNNKRAVLCPGCGSDDIVTTFDEPRDDRDDRDRDDRDREGEGE